MTSRWRWGGRSTCPNRVLIAPPPPLFLWSRPHPSTIEMDPSTPSLFFFSLIIIVVVVHSPLGDSSSRAITMRRFIVMLQGALVKLSDPLPKRHNIQSHSVIICQLALASRSPSPRCHCVCADLALQLFQLHFSFPGIHAMRRPFTAHLARTADSPSYSLF